VTTPSLKQSQKARPSERDDGQPGTRSWAVTKIDDEIRGDAKNGRLTTPRRMIAWEEENDRPLFNRPLPEEWHYEVADRGHRIFGKRLAERLKTMGVTKSDVARSIGFTVGSLTTWTTRGPATPRAFPNVRDFLLLAATLRVDPADLLPSLAELTGHQEGAVVKDDPAEATEEPAGAEETPKKSPEPAKEAIEPPTTVRGAMEAALLARLQRRMQDPNFVDQVLMIALTERSVGERNAGRSANTNGGV